MIDRAVYKIFGCSSAEGTNYISASVDLLSEVYTDHRRSRLSHTYCLDYLWSLVMNVVTDGPSPISANK